MRKLTLDAPAKLNLFLGITPTITNGKHQLISVFTKISLADTLEFTLDESRPADIKLDIEYHDGIMPLSIDPDENIICKTCRAFADLIGSPLAGHLQIKLFKRIPDQGGLGGGSSDAATTIRALAQLQGQDFRDERFLNLAASLGSDVPFFLYDDCALMGGSGEVHLQTLPKPALDLVLVKPAAGVSTAAAYREFDRNPQPAGDVTPLLNALTAANPNTPAIAAAMENNLYPAASVLLPELEELTRALERQPGVLRALLTGSGATVFGVCKDTAAAQAVQETFAAQGYWAQVCATGQHDHS